MGTPHDRSLDPLLPKHGGYRKLKSFRLAQLIYDVTVRFCERYVDKKSRTLDQMVQAARSGVQNIAEGSQASGTSKKMELKLTGVARASLEELRLDYEDFLRQRGAERWPPNHPALVRFKARRCATLAEVQEWVENERRLARANRAKLAKGNTDEHGQRQNTDEHGLTRTDTDSGGGAGGGAEGGGSARTGSGAEAGSGAVAGSGAPAGGGEKSVPVRVSPCSSVFPPSVFPPSMPSAALAANAALSLLNVCCHLLDRQLQAQADTFEREGGFTERLYRTRQARRRGQ